MKFPPQTARMVGIERRRRESPDFDSLYITNSTIYSFKIQIMQSWTQKYSKIEQLGQGSSGLIFKVLNKQTNEIIAAKIIKSSSDQVELQSIELQVKIMTTCLHKNITKCLGVQVFEGEVWILMEYCQGGSLSDMMISRQCTFPEDQICQIMGQVLEGLRCLHQRKIIHRDIKASNLLIKDGIVKIADFGVSLQNDCTISESKFSKIGSPFWMSPEILSQSLYTEKTDVWALGITAIELAEGQPPYSHQHPFRAIYSIQTHPPKGLQSPQKWSKQFNNFISLCLTVQHKVRPSVEDLLTHKFLDKKVNFSPSENSFDDCEIQQLEHDQQNTIIMHDELPKSFWQMGSFPQTEQKFIEESQQQHEETVVINENAEENMFLFSQLKKSYEESMMNAKRTIKEKAKQNMISNEQVTFSVGEKEKKVKQLYRMMEEEVCSVRQKYMRQIREIYLPSVGNNDEQKWESPVKRLKQKTKTLRNNEGSLLSSELLKRIL